MKAWSAALAAEVADWPRATARSFFGFSALYHGDNIFGMLPRTRSFGNGNLLAFRIDDETDRLKVRLKKDHRIGSIDQNNSRWSTFELSSDADLHVSARLARCSLRGGGQSAEIQIVIDGL